MHSWKVVLVLLGVLVLCASRDSSSSGEVRWPDWVCASVVRCLSCSKLLMSRELLSSLVISPIRLELLGGGLGGDG